MNQSHVRQLTTNVTRIMTVIALTLPLLLMLMMTKVPQTSATMPGEMAESESNLDDLRWEFQSLATDFDRKSAAQRLANENLQAQVARLQETIYILIEKARSQQTEITAQRYEITAHHDKITKQGKEIIHLYSLLKMKQDHAPCALTNTIHPVVHACVGESLTMQCNAGFTITVLRAEYGRYADDCSSGCCEPTDVDCTEIMTETNAAEWQSIKASCDGQTTCDYLYTGHLIEGCALNYTADYVQFRYHCTDFVGFYATAPNSQSPAGGDIIKFATVDLNIGGGYNSSTSVFTCPLTGFYYIYFHLNLLMDDGNHQNGCHARIKMDSTVMASGYDDIGHGARHHTMMSQSAVLECQKGSGIWLESDHDFGCYIHGDGIKYSTFGGFILRQL